MIDSTPPIGKVCDVCRQWVGPSPYAIKQEGDPRTFDVCRGCAKGTSVADVVNRRLQLEADFKRRGVR